MSNQEIKVGDVVRLKSGSPRMTVQALNRGNKGDMTECIWFVQEEPKSGLFVAGTLEIDEEQLAESIQGAG